MSKLRFFVGQGFLVFLPALLVLLLAPGAPKEAADLSIAMGLVGALFSISYFGQRAYVAIRGFDVIPCRQALSFRAFLSMAAASIAIAAAGGMNIAFGIVVFAAALKLSEGVIDIWVGVRLRLSSSDEVSRKFAAISVIRAVLVTLPIMVMGAYGALQSPLVVLYYLGLVALFYVIAHIDTRRLGVQGSYALSPRTMWKHGWEMRAFVSATATCALLSSLPRIILPYAAAKDYAAEAMALSIVPLCGLTFQAAWLNGMKRMADAPRKHARTFVLEVAAIVALTALLYPMWKWIAASFYGLAEVAAQARFAAMIFCGVLITGAISLSNLFKLTPRPRNESCNYLLGIVAIVIAVFLFGADARQALSAGATTMLLFILVLYRSEERAGEPAESTDLARARAS